MTCPTCGRYAPPDRETGYDGDDYCSEACELIAEGHRWEQEKHLADVRELDHHSRLQKALAAYFLFVYKENCGNGVTDFLTGKGGAEN